MATRPAPQLSGSSALSSQELMVSSSSSFGRGSPSGGMFCVRRLSATRKQERSIRGIGRPIAEDIQNNASLCRGVIMAVQAVSIEQWRDVSGINWRDTASGGFDRGRLGLEVLPRPRDHSDRLAGAQCANAVSSMPQPAQQLRTHVALSSLNWLAFMVRLTDGLGSHGDLQDLRPPL